MKKLLISGLLSVVAGAVMAQTLPNGTGFLTYTLNSGTYMYDIHLSNTGSTTIGTLWFAWNPGQDYMPSQPTDVIAPNGWSESVTHGGSNDGYGIKFTANSSADDLQASDSLSGFEFSSVDAPGIMNGQSGFYQGANVGDSFLYHAGPFSDNGTQITLQAVPEPMDIIWIVPAVGLLFTRRLRMN